MKKTILADTGPLYALTDPSDQFHTRSRSELDAIETRGFLVAASYARQWLVEVLEGAVLLNPEPADFRAAATQLDRFPDPPHHAGGRSHRVHGREAQNTSLDV